MSIMKWFHLILMSMGFLTHFKPAKSTFGVTVRTKNGIIVGSSKSMPSGTNLRVWLGVPYAKPPVEELRFRRPVKIGNWTRPLQTQQQPKVCYQTSDSGYMVLEKTFYMWDPKTEMSEDCLYLNIYAPEVSKKSKKKLSTVIWIHGGGFYKGAVSLDQYNPSEFADRENIIVVTIQYRLGSFGLLFFENIKIPGNMGMLDQAMAIQWVSDNIYFFGGNKGDITLMGESAGSASVGYHMMSTLTKDLFQKAIMQSGSPLCFWAWALPDEQHRRSIIFSWYAGCHYHRDFDKVHKCLMKKTPQELLAADKSILSLAPTIDGYFMTTDPFAAVMETRTEKRKPILAGVVQNEGMPGIIYFMRQIKKIDYSNFKPEDFAAFFRVFLKYTNIPLETLMKLSVYYGWRYTDKATEVTDYGEAADQMFGDYFISCCSLSFLEKARHFAHPLYFYYFNHRSLMCPDPPYTDVMHGSEIQYQFGQPILKHDRYDEDDKALSIQLMKAWGTFIKTGKPSEKWPNYFRDKKYAVIRMWNENRTVLHREPFCNRWRDMFTNILSARDVKRFMRFAVQESLGSIGGSIIWEFIRGSYPEFIN